VLHIELPGPALSNIEALLTLGSATAATQPGEHSSLFENSEAVQNMQDIVEILVTSHADTSQLKDVADLNI